LRFFFDMCLSPKLAKAMVDLDQPVCHLTETFSPDTPDEVWMPVVARSKQIVVTSDRRIYNNEGQRRLARSLGMVFMMLPEGFEREKAMRQLELLAKYWPPILKRAERINPGEFWLVQVNGKIEIGTKS
jgi:hypothetical protein